MQSNFVEHPPADSAEAILHPMTGYIEPTYLNSEETAQGQTETTQFQSRFIDCMEMFADRATVVEYLDAHHGWFRRCAHPMRVEPLGENGYALILGPYGSFGYQVEPRVGLDLLPQDQGVYRIKTIPVPDYVPQGYDVDFQAALELVEVPTEQVAEMAKIKRSAIADLSPMMTRVEWQLDLVVSVQFPKFIHTLPQHIIQSTGDRLLYQVVKQISRRLTYKVQEDFHNEIGVPFPKHFKRKLG
jgi:hypothetical protein